MRRGSLIGRCPFLARRRGCLACFVYALALTAPTAQAEQLDWLYDVSVAIASQAPADQRDAARRALVVVLGRVSGLPHVPRSQEVVKALRRPEDFYSQFSFETVSEDESLRMVVRFDVAAIMDLVGAARLPVWTIDRPRVLLWAVAEENRARRLLQDGDPEVDIIRSIARARGISVSFPTAPVSDLRLAKIWGGFWETIDTASEAYSPDVVAVAQLNHDAGRVNWELRSFDADLARPFEGDAISLRREDGVDDLMATLGHALADDLAQELAVLNRGVQHFEVHVSGIRTVDDYADLLDFLATREYLERVDLRRMVTRDMEFVLQSRSSRRQLEKLLLLSERFARDGAEGTRAGGALTLRWEGS